MRRWIKFSTRFISEKEEAASLVEYALLVGLIALVCIAGITATGTSINTLLTNIGTALTAA